MIKGAEGGKKRERCRAALIIIYHGIAIAYWYNVRDRGTLLTIPFAILWSNRLLNSTCDHTPKRFLTWLGFYIIWVISVAADRYSAPSHSSGFFIAFFPTWALFGYWAYLDYQTRVHEIVRRYSRRIEKQGTAALNLERGDPLLAPSRRPTFDASRATVPARSRRRDSGASPDD